MIETRKIYWWLFILLIFSSSCASSKKMAVRDQKIEKLVSTARTYLGTPYQWGGITRSGMDCSGLLYCSFGAINVQLPRTSEAQEKTGKKVKINNLQPGDLVFFATGKRKRKITHVGMVTRVRSRNEIYFIHSSTSKGVVENNLFQNYYIKRFRVGRRIL